ncbi:hypothetical protein ZWY2020_031704, partial [Hordeum vulgare]
EYIYAFAHDYGLNGSEPVEIVSWNNKKFSSLLNFLDNSVNHPNQDRLLDYKKMSFTESPVIVKLYR